MTTPATEEQIAHFSSITGSNVEQAKFFLESSNNDADAAVSAFFDSGGAVGEAPSNEQDFDELDQDDNEEEEDFEMESNVPAVTARAPATAAAAVPSVMGGGGGRTLGGGSGAGAYIPTPPRAAAPSISANWGSTSSSNSSSRSATPSNPFRSNQGPRVSTLRDLNAASTSAPPSRGPPADDEEDDDQLEFFTGGEKSGLSVENPNARKKKLGSSDAIKDILARAQAGGEASAAAAANAQNRSVFSGAAHTLGSDEAPSTFIPDPTRAGRASKPHMPGTFQSMDDEEEDEVEDEITIRHMHFFSDGFSIDDGDLLPYDVPANQDLLEALRTGRAPLSVLKIRQNQRVELRIAERRQEKYSRQAPADHGPFEGSGNRLGDAASSTITSSTPTSTSARTTTPASTAGTQTISLSDVFEVDSSAPVTNLQIRLRDGTRMVARFNHTHTVGDVRRYINASNPGQSSTNYALMTTFPSKDLEDDKATLKDANLLGSVIVQRGL